MKFHLHVTALTLLALLSTSLSSSITLAPSQYMYSKGGAPSPLQFMYSRGGEGGAPSPLQYMYSDGGAPTALLGSEGPTPLTTTTGSPSASIQEAPSGLLEKVRRVCSVVPAPEDCVGPYRFPEARGTREEDVTAFNVFMRMVRDVQTSIWMGWTVEGEGRAVGACREMYGRAAAEMEDVNEYNYGIDFERTNAHTWREYAEAAEKIVDDVFEATYPATERCNRAVGNAFVGEERKEAVFQEVVARNMEIRRKYANCKAMAQFMADQV